MSKKIRNKLQSERGASLIMALLLFLVCMVVASVLITAATASAGRLSQMVEMDKRYYAVSSAASMLTEQINGKTVTVTCTDGAMSAEKIIEGEKKSISYSRKADGTWDRSDTLSYSKLDFIDAFLTDQTIELLDGEIKKAELNNKSSTFTIQPEDGAKYQDQLKVEMVAKWKPTSERTMELTVHNAGGAAGSDTYQIRLTCTADVLEHTSLVSVAGKKEKVEQTVYEVTWSVPELGRLRDGGEG